MSDLVSHFFIFAGQSVLGIAAFGVVTEVMIWFYDRYRQRRRMKRYNPRGKYVLITGASSGLGRALAREFYLSGAKVIVAARSLAKLRELCDELKNINRRSVSIDNRERAIATSELLEPAFHYLDLADTSTIAEAVTDILKMTNGRLDILVNNAGISVRGSCAETSMNVHRQLMEVNYFGHVELTQLLLPAMQNTAATRKPGYQGPCIVCISSVQGRFSIPNRSAYVASKHAFQAYFDCLRAELEAVGGKNDPKVRVLVVSPSYIATNLSLNALTGDGSRHGKMDETTKSGLPPEQAAKRVVKSVIDCHKELILASCGPRLVVVLRPLTPWLYFWWTAKRARKEKLKELEDRS